ncbi:MAG: ABC transporter permease [Muribaculaceae bacterium]|nr:ABC transporter permease [Muribaculaceae bacterium]
MSRLSLKVASRYIFARKSHSAVNLISIVAVCGVIITTAAIVCVLSVFNGFTHLVESKLSAIDPDIKIEATHGKTIENADSIINIIKQINGVSMAMPTIEENALAAFNSNQKPVIIKGVTADYEKATKVDSITKEDGRFLLHDEMGNHAVISVGSAIALQARPGYSALLRLYAPRRVGRINIANPIGAFRADSLFVAGVFQVDQAEYDENTIFVPIAVARHLFDYPTQATAIEVSTIKGNDIDNTVAAISEKLGEEYSVKDRLKQQESSFRMINIEKWVTFLLLGFIMIIATFNVISTIAVLIVDKGNDIATLINLGADNKFITSIFTSQTWLITLFGAIIGIIIGVLLCLCQEYFGIIKLAGNTSTLIIDTYPVMVKFTDLAIVFLLSLFISLLSSMVTKLIMRARLRSYKEVA